jgi:hypothetical protein
MIDIGHCETCSRRRRLVSSGICIQCDREERRRACPHHLERTYEVPWDNAVYCSFCGQFGGIFTVILPGFDDPYWLWSARAHLVYALTAVLWRSRSTPIRGG